jgi:hypothetical protein
VQEAEEPEPEMRQEPVPGAKLRFCTYLKGANS